jgi:hypothetical protein
MNVSRPEPESDNAEIGSSRAENNSSRMEEIVDLGESSFITSVYVRRLLVAVQSEDLWIFTFLNRFNETFIAVFTMANPNSPFFVCYILLWW